MQRNRMRWGATLAVGVLAMTTVSAQPPQRSLTSSEAATPAAVVPPGYLIGAQDVLTITFWKDPDKSGDVIVRPDGKISIPLLNDIQAAGRTPEELRVALVEAAKKWDTEPTPTVVVKAIHSRLVYITGNIAKPSSYPLNGDMDVLKLITLAGGLLEYAQSDKILILRTQNGKSEYLRFNYKDVLKQKNVQQNIMLRPGDQIVVP
jgi:polysaccharide export outer membrane protein